MAAIDEVLARIDRETAIKTLHGVRNKTITCPECNADIEIGSDDDDDSLLDKMNKQNNPISAQEQLAQALLESVKRNSAKPQPQHVNRPAQKPSTQRAQASQAPHSEEDAGLVLARAIAELRGEKR